MARYTVTMSWGETWTMIGNFSVTAGSSPICTEEEEDGEVFCTPFVVGDACHDPQRAAEMVVRWWDSEGGGYLGGDGHVVSVEAA